MPVEVERYRTRPDGSDDSKPTITVQPGSVESVNFFGPALRLLVVCGTNNLSGTVFIKPRSTSHLRRLYGLVYDKEDSQGTRVELHGGRITILKSQELSLFLTRGRKRKSVKELYISMPSDNGNSTDEIPQDKKPVFA